MYAEAYCTGDCELLDPAAVFACNEAGTTCYPMAIREPGVFDPEDLDTGTLGAMFAAGFVIVATGWAIGRGVKILLSMLK